MGDWATWLVFLAGGITGTVATFAWIGVATFAADVDDAHTPTSLVTNAPSEASAATPEPLDEVKIVGEWGGWGDPMDWYNDDESGT